MYHPSYNIGIEEEYQLIDPNSRELLGYITQSIEREQMLVHEKNPDLDFAQRFSSAVLEAGTLVCADIREAREQLLRLRTKILDLGIKHGFRARHRVYTSLATRKNRRNQCHAIVPLQKMPR